MCQHNGISDANALSLPASFQTPLKARNGYLWSTESDTRFTQSHDNRLAPLARGEGVIREIGEREIKRVPPGGGEVGRKRRETDQIEWRTVL